jgi:hypothetical protein
MGVGILGSNFATVGMRLYLMAHAGCPGGPNNQIAMREKVVTNEEKQRIEIPTMGTILKGAFRGFG